MNIKNQPINRALEKLLNTLEELRDTLGGSGVIDEIENAVAEIAEKYGIELK